ncbi:unnamed protein product [Owenia fusiformis]|uniref:Uncharacterized protein n=1 Tax=Owenia fusiformis TaxID=6347 RepID=A0A8J1TGB2_OWEFU|nr:unnamed protein product [Owenia fusiformis]
MFNQTADHIKEEIFLHLEAFSEIYMEFVPEGESYSKVVQDLGSSWTALAEDLDCVLDILELDLDEADEVDEVATIRGKQGTKKKTSTQGAKKRNTLIVNPLPSLKDLQSKAGGCFERAIVKISSDPMAKAYPSGSRADVAVTIATKLKELPFGEFPSVLMSFLYPTLDSSKSAQLKANKSFNMLQSLHQCKISKEVTKLFSDFYSNIGIEYKDSFLSIKIIDEMFKEICFQVNSSINLPSTLPSPTDLSLSQDEESTLSYISGFIPHSLIKQLSKSKGRNSEILVKCLNSWKVKDEDDLNPSAEHFETYRNSWTAQINRGGLFIVNSSVYSFFRQIELIVRKSLNVSNVVRLNSSNIDQHILEELSVDENVQQAWGEITEHIFDDSLNTLLMKKVLSKFVTLRAKSFVKFWKNKLEDIDRQGTHSLRAVLSASRKSKKM